MKMKRRGFLKGLLGSVTAPACLDFRKADPPAAPVVDGCHTHAVHRPQIGDHTHTIDSAHSRVLTAEDICDKDMVFINTDGRVGIGHCPTEALRIEVDGLSWGTGETPGQTLVIKS
jgi:hypothetical protein